MNDAIINGHHYTAHRSYVACVTDSSWIFTNTNMLNRFNLQKKFRFIVLFEMQTFLRVQSVELECLLNLSKTRYKTILQYDLIRYEIIYFI